MVADKYQRWTPRATRNAKSVAGETKGNRGRVLTGVCFDGTSIVEARQALAELVHEPRIDTIVIEFDTPGGGTDGLLEFAAELRAARQKKAIIAFVNTQCCSAGYRLAAQCTEVICTPSGEVGSVGVFMVHSDFSQMNERMGVKPTYIASPRYKAEGIPIPHCPRRRADICKARSIAFTASSSPTSCAAAG